MQLLPDESPFLVLSVERHGGVIGGVFVTCVIMFPSKQVCHGILAKQRNPDNRAKAASQEGAQFALRCEPADVHWLGTAAY